MLLIFIRRAKVIMIILFTVLVSVICLAETSELADRAAFIANNAFEPRQSTPVIWWRSDTHIINNFLINYRGSVVTVKIAGCANSSEFHEEINYKQTVFFASNPEEFEYFLVHVNGSVIYPIRVILVITTSIKEISLENYTKISLANDVSDIIIIHTNHDNNITLSTYMPYGPTGCRNYKPVTLQADDKSLFPQKFRNFYGCPIKIISVNASPYSIYMNNNSKDLQGIDIDYTNIIFEKLNSSTYNNLSSNSGAHIYVHVANGSYDMALPSIVVDLNRYQNAQMSHIFKTMDIVLCAPNQREIYTWAKVLLPFFTNTTPLIILSFLFFVGSVALIQRYGRFPRNSPKGIAFGTLGLFLGQDMKYETKYWLNNGIFMVWIWYCTIVRIGYQGDLVDGLQKTFLEPHLKTSRQALAVVDEYGGVEGFLNFFSLNSSANKKSTIVAWRYTPHYIEQISKGRKFLLISDLASIHSSPHKVQVVDERLPGKPVGFFMRPRWGAAKEINRRMIQLFEAGFMAKFVTDYHSVKVKAMGGTSAERIAPLTMTTVASCFFGLVILGFLWTIVLCFEIIWYYFSVQRKLRDNR